MQGLDRPREKPPAQEQWQAIGKQCEEQWKQSEIRARDQCSVVAPEDKKPLRRRRRADRF
jgi:hypothetical protein